MSSVPDGFKVIVHIGSCCLRDSVKLAAHAQEIGAYGIGMADFLFANKTDKQMEELDAIVGEEVRLNGKMAIVYTDEEKLP